MKDESKAKWPEKMIGTRIVDDDGRRVYIICGQGTHDASVWSEDTDTIEARAKQVRALPRMVALLKGLAEMYVTYKQSGIESSLDDYYREAYEICRDIGEVE